jgi:hypothetical protein
MRVATLSFLALTSLCADVRACTDGRTPNLSEAQAVQIASEAAQNAGNDLAKFKTPEIRFEISGPGCYWSLAYETLEPALGRDFSVTVNDSSRNVRIFGGM